MYIGPFQATDHDVISDLHDGWQALERSLKYLVADLAGFRVQSIPWIYVYSLPPRD